MKAPPRAARGGAWGQGVASPGRWVNKGVSTAGAEGGGGCPPFAFRAAFATEGRVCGTKLPFAGGAQLFAEVAEAPETKGSLKPFAAFGFKVSYQPTCFHRASRQGNAVEERW